MLRLVQNHPRFYQYREIYGLFCAQSYLQPTINVTLEHKCIATAKKKLKQWHEAFQETVPYAQSAIESISCASEDDCDDPPSGKRSKLTLDEILSGEGFNIVKKVGHPQMPSTVTNLDAEFMDYEELVRIAPDNNTERTFMAFSVFASAQMISNLDDEMVKFWKRHETHLPCLRVLTEVARALPPGNGDVERLFSILKLLKQLHRNRLTVNNMEFRLKTRFFKDIS